MHPSASSDEPPQRLSWSGMTHVGRVRKNNEDAFLALTYNDREVDLEPHTRVSVARLTLP